MRKMGWRQGRWDRENLNFLLLHLHPSIHPYPYHSPSPLISISALLFYQWPENTCKLIVVTILFWFLEADETVLLRFVLQRWC